MSFLADLLDSSVVRFIISNAAIILLTLLALRLIRVGANRLERRFVQPAGDREQRARIQTLIVVITNTTSLVVVALAIATILLTLGVNLGPVLAAAGVVGLGVSLGAQTLIKDYIGGLLILLEDQFRVGDSVELGTANGVVENITLRATYLRDIQGRQIIVPNGDVRTVFNGSRGWTRVVIDLNFDFNTDIDQVTSILNGAMERACAEAEVAEFMLEKPVVRGGNTPDDWSIQMRIMAKTTPERQWDVATTLRRVALDALNQAGIRVVMAPDTTPKT